MKSQQIKDKQELSIPDSLNKKIPSQLVKP